MATIEEIMSFNISDVSVREQVEAIYKSTDAIVRFAKSGMIAVLNNTMILDASVGKLSAKDKAIIGTYFRMYAWLSSMVVMNDPIHYQGAAAAARSLFELLLDIKMLADDKSGDMINKFHAFPAVEKYRVSVKIVDFVESHPNDSKIEYSIQKKLIRQPGKKESIEKIIIEHWGMNNKGEPKWPKHWSGKNIKDRAKDLGIKYYAVYIESFSQLSWLIHSGSTAYVGLSADAIESFFAIAHHIAQQAFLEATIICAKTQNIDKAVEDFQEMINHLNLSPGQVLLEDHIKKLAERKSGQGAKSPL